jgi:hypothetical protein
VSQGDGNEELRPAVDEERLARRELEDHLPEIPDQQPREGQAQAPPPGPEGLPQHVDGSQGHQGAIDARETAVLDHSGSQHPDASGDQQRGQHGAEKKDTTTPPKLQRAAHDGEHQEVPTEVLA